MRIQPAETGTLDLVDYPRLALTTASVDLQGKNISHPEIVSLYRKGHITIFGRIVAAVGNPLVFVTSSTEVVRSAPW
jgi:hypothetical protein